MRLTTLGLNLTLFVFSALIALIGAEITLRRLGYQPWQVKDIKIAVEPGGKFFAKHPRLGYTHLPGEFKVTLPDGYGFKVTHLPNTLRITHPLDTYGVGLRKDELWIFGCSFTYGWTLNDEETYPWLLQQQLPEVEVVNFGVSGYGTLQSFIQFQEALAARPKPRLVIIAYASFHDQRNTLLRLRSKQIVPWNKLGPIVQPYATIDEKGLLNYAMAEMSYREFPLMRTSALMNFIETTYDYKVEDAFYNSHTVTQAIIKEFHQLAKEQGIELVVVGLLPDRLTTDTLAYSAGQGIMTADISVDLSRRSYRNWPHDPHPSPAANQQYASKLGDFLRNNILKIRD
ncbi:MAG TPA: SGNH/GDSL hydrolase family protein [Anaerolineae bacterium]|nr:SGNH/GDSL hydrolase family protein [Anaerolineae bacterium]